ncbi:hypothetical protein KQP59_00075, partial [Bacteroides thetaiotaomicron]
SLERISGELLTRSFSYSALRTYMHIPTKKLLTRFYPAGFTERLYPEIAYLNRVGGCIHALGIAVESPQPLGEDLEAESPTVYGNAQILQKKSVLIY